jgi:hypothetical protein
MKILRPLPEQGRIARLAKRKSPFSPGEYLEL